MIIKLTIVNNYSNEKGRPIHQTVMLNLRVFYMLE